MSKDKKTSDYYSRARFDMLKFIPLGSKTVLDVGCGEGFFGKKIKNDRKAEVWGIEINKEVGVKAKRGLDKVIIKDINEALKDLPDKYFDCVVFNDVLEHLIDPYSLLKKIKGKLTKEGVVVCSIPNVRHLKVLKKLLIDKQWKYEDDGILDKTHLRFFTRRSIIEMFKELDYEIRLIQGINPTKWRKLFVFLNLLSLGYLSDTRYLQYACVVKPK